MHDSTLTPGSIQALQALRILAIDLGKFKSVACDYEREKGSEGVGSEGVGSRFLGVRVG